jgi:hypothetical protein
MKFSKPQSRFRWVVLAFIAYGLLTGALLVWQLMATTPTKWCAIAENNDINQGCFTLLLRILDIKDHTIIGLLLIMGLTALSVVAVTLKVRMDAEGPGGIKAKIGADTTTVEPTPNGESSVEIDTPPATPPESVG